MTALRSGARTALAPNDPQNFGRMELAKFRARMKDAGIVITQGYLRDDYALSGTTTGLIQWTLTQIQNGVAQANTAQRLKNDDAFLVMKIGVFIGFTDTTGGVESAAQQNGMVLHSFPDDVLMLGAGNILALKQLYNGWVSVKTGSITYFEQLEMYEFLRVDTAQQGLQASQQAAAVGTAGAYFRSAWDRNNGFISLETPFAMAGDKNYQYNLNLALAATFAALSGTNGKLYATIRLGGYLATGGKSALAGIR